MATLFGTTASGESLPVQVNEFGQLVAQGLPGPQGEQGEQGPIGLPGDFQFSSGTFVPEFISSDPSGAGSFTYQLQDGFWYLFGPLLTVTWYVKTTSTALTNTLGNAEIGGLPPEISFATPSLNTARAPFAVNELTSEASGQALGGRIIYRQPRNSFHPLGLWEGSWSSLLWADLDSPNGSSNVCAGSFSGLVYGSVPSVRFDLDDLM